LGTAPTNASDFDKLIAKFPPDQHVRYSVIGFGSKAYPDFCAYARYIDELLAKQPWATSCLDLHTINDHSIEEFTVWIKSWNQHSFCKLDPTPALYTAKT